MLGPRGTLILAVVATSWAAILVLACGEPPPATPAGTIALWRLALAAGLLAPFARVDRHSGRAFPQAPAGGRERAAPLALVARHPHLVTLLAAGCLALHFVTWFLSLEHTTVGISTVLVSTQPLFGVLLAPWILGESVGPRAVAGAVLAVLGAAVIVGGDLDPSPGDLVGGGLALAAAALAAVYLILGRGLRARWPLPRYLVLVNGGAAGWLLAGCLVAGGPVFPAQASHWVWIAGLAVVPHLVGHGLLNRAVRMLPATVVNTAVLGEPVLATLWAWWILGQRPGLSLVAGGGLVLAGILLAVREGRVAGGGRDVRP